MKTADIRQEFLQYFADHGHEIVASSPLVPGNDPTLLFTNAGMVQFKDVFLGQDKRSYSRATTSQRCVRAGGKHNDLENVGYTARHHTFFEMLGNFSFGDYFKREAIDFAWNFLTKVLGLPEEKLWVTVFEDDDETADIWLKELKVDPNRFSRCGEKDNFWAMGDVGPCGPCTEIFYDHGPDVAGGPPGSPDEDGDRYIEIWNLVFMQYSRDSDGNLTALPKPSVDTGMGLERIAAVMQGVHSNYEIDLFQNLIKAIAKILKVDDLTQRSLYVIADHIRATAFLIVDGVIPGNEGRNYVLRRIMRRAIRYGYKLGAKEPFFYKVVEALVKEMGDAYPELKRSHLQIETIIYKEEEQFARTLEQGMKILNTAIEGLAGKVIPGETVFRLYDTYGFPVDLTADIARELELTIDEEGFEAQMQLQRQQSKAASQFSSKALLESGIKVDVDSEFTGYDYLESSSEVLALYQDDGTAVNELAPGPGIVVLAKTPFYAESGGQIGDKGELDFADGKFIVHDTQKQAGGIMHIGELTGAALTLNTPVTAKVSMVTRRATMLNHSATHLLHAALRHYLGEHVLQKGSLVDAERLRFDFVHFAPLTEQEIHDIEVMVNQAIRHNYEVVTELMTPKDAAASGAMALFGEKYGDTVRVLSMGDFSKELCGGTHVSRTGDIGLFKVTAESGIAAGIRRVEAVTGAAALDLVNFQQRQLKGAASMLRTTERHVAEKLQQLQQHNKQLEKDIQRYKAKLASEAGSDLVSQAADIHGVKVLAVELEGADVKSLRDTLDQLKNKLGSAVVVLAAVADDKVNVIAGVTKDSTSRVKAGELVNMVALQVGGRGGGRPDMAQAGGTQPENLPKALASVEEWVAEKLS